MPDLVSLKAVNILFDDETVTFYITPSYANMKSFKVSENKGNYTLSNKAFVNYFIRTLGLPLGKPIANTDKILSTMRLEVSPTPETIGGFKNLHKIIWNAQ